MKILQKVKCYFGWHTETVLRQFDKYWKQTQCLDCKKKFLLSTTPFMIGGIERTEWIEPVEKLFKGQYPKEFI